MEEKFFDRKYDDFLDIWFKIIIGQQKPTDLAFKDIKELKALLSDSMKIRLDQTLTLLGFKFDLSMDDESFIKQIVQNFKDANVHDHGFYPLGIEKYKGLSCAGSAMLVSHLLDKKSILHFYARPVGHSVNIITTNNDYLWLDAHNGIFERIDATIIAEHDVNYLLIDTTNPRIDYKLAILLDPADTYYQIFGNFENLKDTRSGDFSAEDIELLSKVDLNEIAQLLFPEIRAFMGKSDVYKKEVLRKRNIPE